jgi:hypothetical protein
MSAPNYDRLIALAKLVEEHGIDAILTDLSDAADVCHDVATGEAQEHWLKLSHALAFALDDARRAETPRDENDVTLAMGLGVLADMTHDEENADAE